MFPIMHGNCPWRQSRGLNLQVGVKESAKMITTVSLADEIAIVDKLIEAQTARVSRQYVMFCLG